MRVGAGRHICGLIAACILISGCAATRHAVPERLMDQAIVSGMKDVRAFSGRPSEPFTQDFLNLLEQENQRDPGWFGSPSVKTYCMLAISGGAANGAYGAGLLNGWSASGTRPEFKVVTGISTGAIIAPMAFLGSEYDDKLEQFYTTYSTKDIMRRRSFSQVLSHKSFASSDPLARLIARHFDTKLLERIAEEYRKGRRLYVGTTNLDAQLLVIWDMGRIASRGDEKALELFRKIILASSSIPVAFPPVYLPVEADGGLYDEMHVDGGITHQVFFLYDVMRGFQQAARQKRLDASKIRYRNYIIRNGYADAVWKECKNTLSAIVNRTIDTMTCSQGMGDLYQLYLFTERSKGEFNLACIPSDFKEEGKEFFDPAQMRRLFDLGYEEAAKGYPWRKAPPGLE